MALGGFVTAAFGITAAVSCVLAFYASRNLKRSRLQSTIWIGAFWHTVGAYMTFFAVLRIASELGASDGLLTTLFYLQTIAGAATIISLSSIVFHVTLATWWSGFGTGIFLALAILVMYLVIQPGVSGPYHDAWSTEFLPDSALARSLIGLVYMLIPVIFAGIIVSVTRRADAVTRRRLQLFALSVVLMYLPNAVKYVILVEGLTNLVLAIIMSAGAVIGWRSYLTTADASGNG